MVRFRLLALPVMSCCLFTACAGLQTMVRVPTTPAPPTPETAIAVSVLSDAIYLVDPSTGSGKTIVTGLVDLQAGFGEWAADHRHLAYGSAGIVVLDTDSGESRRLNQGQSISMPAWSVDDREFAYTDGLSLWVTPSTRSEPVRMPLPQTLAPVDPSWDPSRVIAFAGQQLDCTSQPGPCASMGTSDIWSIHPDGSDLTQVTEVGGALYPVWSPDGSTLLFVRHVVVRRVGQSQLWTVRPNGTRLRRITDATNVVAADWSPDGKQIAYLSPGDEPDTLQMWIVGTDGSGLRAVGQALSGTDAALDW